MDELGIIKKLSFYSSDVCELIVAFIPFEVFRYMIENRIFKRYSHIGLTTMRLPKRLELHQRNPDPGDIFNMFDQANLLGRVVIILMRHNITYEEKRAMGISWPNIVKCYGDENCGHLYFKEFDQNVMVYPDGVPCLPALTGSGI